MSFSAACRAPCLPGWFDAGAEAVTHPKDKGRCFRALSVTRSGVCGEFLEFSETLEYGAALLIRTTDCGFADRAFRIGIQGFCLLLMRLSPRPVRQSRKPINHHTQFWSADLRLRRLIPLERPLRSQAEHGCEDAPVVFPPPEAGGAAWQSRPCP